MYLAPYLEDELKPPIPIHLQGQGEAPSYLTFVARLQAFNLRAPPPSCPPLPPLGRAWKARYEGLQKTHPPVGVDGGTICDGCLLGFHWSVWTDRVVSAFDWLRSRRERTRVLWQKLVWLAVWRPVIRLSNVCHMESKLFNLGSNKCLQQLCSNLGLKTQILEPRFHQNHVCVCVWLEPRQRTCHSSIKYRHQ